MGLLTGMLAKIGIGKTAEVVGEAATGVIDALGDAGDKLFTSDEERAQWAVMLEKVKQEPLQLQAIITAISTASPSPFVANARAWVLYALAFVLVYGVVVRDALILSLGIKPEDVPAMSLEPGVILRFLGGLLGLGA